MPKSETSCLCGAVKITADEINPKFTVCHCDSCRAWGGAPFFAVHCGTKLRIEGNENVKVYDSSTWASRGFCTECGTHLFFKFRESGDYSVPVGLFPNLEGLEMNMQYFSDQRPSYYCFTNQTKQMTKAELMNKIKRPVNSHKAYHAHVYYERDTLEFASGLCQEAGDLFGLGIGRAHEALVGPHPKWSCQISFGSKDFDTLVPWLDQNRENLTVLIHPLSGNDLEDHTTFAYWLGDSVELDLSIFEAGD